MAIYPSVLIRYICTVKHIQNTMYIRRELPKHNYKY